ncbi:MAG: hypothetical protein AAGA08_16695 [Pseudomonadota bacterium]
MESLFVAAVDFGSGGPSVPLLRILFALIVGTFAAFIGALWIKRAGGQLPQFFRRVSDDEDQSRIALLQMKRIRPGWDVALIECDEEQYFVLMSQTQAVLLGQSSKGGIR